MLAVRPWLWPTLALALSACTCGPANVTRAYGALGVSVGDAEATREAQVDFGPVAVGSALTREVFVSNLGAAPMTLRALRAEGADVAFSADDGVAPFVVSPDAAGLEVRPGERVRLEVRYRPAGVAPQQAVVSVEADNARDGEASARITLRGLPERSRCALPDTLDFGVVGVGTTGVESFTVLNDTVLPADLTLGAPVGADAAAFAFTGEVSSGATSVPPSGTATVSLRFDPTEPRAYRALLAARAHPSCPEGRVALTGVAVAPAVRWSPDALDFGVVALGGRALRAVTFTNTSAEAVSVTRFAVRGPYRVLDAQGQPLTTLSVPPQGAASLQVEFAPARAGTQPTALAFALSAQQARGAIPLRGVAAGPAIQVTPAAVALGPVAYFPSASAPQSTTRRLVIQNVGTAPSPPALDGNLQLGRPGVAGVRGPPYWEVRPTTGTTRATEFSVAMRGAPYDPTTGLVARAGANALELTVALTPESLGPKSAELVLFSNDPTRPELVVPLSGEALSLPPCVYALTPTTLDFGAVLPGVVLERSFTLTNLSTAIGAACLVTQVDLTPTTHPAFSLAAPVPSTTLAPGQSMEVRVRLSPTGATPATPVPLSGEVELRLSSDTTPRRVVDVRALLGAPCVSITPSANFGSVPFGCGSGTQSVDVTNTCGWPVTLVDAVITQGAGQPAGGPQCAGATACPEFTLLSGVPAAGLTLAPAQRHPLLVRYQPLDLGADVGELTVSASLGGAAVAQVVTLSGSGTAGGCVDCFPLAPSTPVFAPSPSGLPYTNAGSNVTGWTGVPSGQGAQLWTTSGSALDSVGFHNFLPVVANSFTLEADVRIGQAISDWQFSLWDASYGVGYKVSLGPSDGDTPYFGLYKVVNDPARNVADRPYGDDLAITCHGAGACNASSVEPAVGDLASVVTASGGYPASGTWFHWTFTKVGGTVTTQVDNLPPVTWTSSCLDRNWRLVFGSWADVSVRNVTIH